MLDKSGSFTQVLLVRCLVLVLILNLLFVTVVFVW